MPEAKDTHGQAFKNGTATFLARIMGWNGVAVVPGDFPAFGASSSSSSSSSGQVYYPVCGLPIEYSIYLLDEEEPDLRTPVAGHHRVALDPAAVLFAALQTDAIWTVDSTGYNFKHTPNNCENQCFEIAGRKYLVEYLLHPIDSSVPIVVRFRVNVI